MMKKIIAILVVMLAFGLNANAQQKSVKAAQTAMPDAQKQENAKQAALKDIASLEQVITFTGTRKEEFTKLFEHKHRMYMQDLSAERKAVVARSIEQKIKASLSPEDIQKIEAEPGLMKKLTQQ